jgi:hypothetical protein
LGRENTFDCGRYETVILLDKSITESGAFSVAFIAVEPVTNISNRDTVVYSEHLYSQPG